VADARELAPAPRRVGGARLVLPDLLASPNLSALEPEVILPNFMVLQHSFPQEFLFPSEFLKVLSAKRYTIGGVVQAKLRQLRVPKRKS